MKGPAPHKNKYEGPTFRGQRGPRDTVCGETIDSTKTTDDWDDVQCMKCLDGRLLHVRANGRFAQCGKLVVGGNITSDRDKATCAKCLAKASWCVGFDCTNVADFGGLCRSCKQVAKGMSGYKDG